MPESTVQVPPDSTGKKMRTRQRVIGANTVEEQYVALGGEPSWTIWTPPAAFAANKHFLSMLNAVGSGQVIKLRKLFLVNMQITAITGIPVQFDIKKITAITAGTAVTPTIHDSTDSALTNFTSVAAPTAVTEGVTIFSAITTNEEVGVVSGTTGGPASLAWQMQQTNLIPESDEGKEYEMNPGEGVTIKNITSSTIGSFSILAVIARAL